MNNHYYYRRFGFFRRVWWFAIGAGVATIWARHHDGRWRERDPNNRRCGSHNYWRRPLPPAEGEQAPQTHQRSYDWSSHKPGVKASMHSAAPPTSSQPADTSVPARSMSQGETIPATVEAPVAVPVPDQAPNHPAGDDAQAQARRELEARAREYTAEQLGRLLSALERLRDGVKGDQQERRQAAEERRWV